MIRRRMNLPAIAHPMPCRMNHCLADPLMIANKKVLAETPEIC